jgi:hypothetical protein
MLDRLIDLVRNVWILNHIESWYNQIGVCQCSYEKTTTLTHGQERVNGAIQNSGYVDTSARVDFVHCGMRLQKVDNSSPPACWSRQVVFHFAISSHGLSRWKICIFKNVIAWLLLRVKDRWCRFFSGVMEWAERQQEAFRFLATWLKVTTQHKRPSTCLVLCGIGGPLHSSQW